MKIFFKKRERRKCSLKMATTAKNVNKSKFVPVTY